VTEVLVPSALVVRIDIVGSRARGEETALSDWDFRIDTTNAAALARELPALVEPLEPLAAQWDRLTERSTYMLMLPGAVKVDLFPGDELRAIQPPWEPTPSNLVAIDAHFWDWALWLGGKVLAELELTGERGICTVVGGAFGAAKWRADGTPEVIEVAPPAELDSLRMTLQQVIEPQGGDVDITAADVLVSVGRGVSSQDDLEVVQELADALGAPLSASRPVVDAGWLPKNRQVGKSGLKVKPKAYLAFGISGAPEHLEGMRDTDLIIACNTDAAAPIFDVAHYGTTLDLFDLVPELVQEVGG